MSTLGKLLIVFNLLAAGAFAYFTLQNWKARQEITWRAFENQVRLDGLALEKQANPPSADDLGTDRVAFHATMPGNVVYESIPKTRFEALIPKGDDTLGGPPVANQTDEIVRVKDKVITGLPAAGQPRFDALRQYNLNIARTGADRDGVSSLFDMRVDTRASAARRDLPFLGRTPSQVGALRTMVELADLGDPQRFMPDTARVSRIALAREAVKGFLLGEVPRGIAPGADKDNAERTLTNLVLDATKDGAGDAQKRALADGATGDKDGWTHLASLAVEPLDRKPSVDQAIATLLAFVQAKAVTDSEKAVYGGVKDLLVPPPLGFNVDKSVEGVALGLLNAKFDDAARPMAAGKAGTGDSAGEKARKIAHLLYHIDAHRHANRDAAVVTARKAWHERVATVVGLPEYIRAAEAEATEYAEASQRLLAVITEEQSAFEAEYQSQLQRVLFQFSQWLSLDNQLRAQEVTTKENVRLKDERLTERDKLVTELADWIEKAKVSLAKLQNTQRQLFRIQKDLRDAQAAILALEKELRRIELGR